MRGIIDFLVEYLDSDRSRFSSAGVKFSSGMQHLRETNMPALNLTELNAALQNVGARWEAAQPAEEHRLGYVPVSEDHSFEEREHLSRASYTRFMAMTAAAAAPPYPPAID